MESNSIRILLIEDDVIDQMAFKRMISLDEPSYSYVIAGSTSEARELLKHDKFDVVVIDFNLGDGTAFDVVSLIKDTPIIFVTGIGDEEMAVRALKAGAFHYLVKDKDRNYLKVMPSTILKAIRHYRIEHERKQVINELRKSEIKHRILLSSFQAPIIGLKDDMTIFYCNRAYSDLMEKQLEELEDKNLLKLFPAIVKTEFFAAVQSVLQTGRQREIEQKVTEKFFVTRIYKAPWGILSISEDITARKKAEQELLHKNQELEKAKRELFLLSRTDSLTKLPNRRDILEKIQAEIYRFERSKQPFSLIICDIDDFKIINDTYGHNAGDFILKTTADIMQKNIRKQDLLARWGGEEFLFLLPDTDLKGCRKVAENIRKIIQDHHFHFEEKDLQITITFGLSMFENGSTIDDCIKRADVALYKGKRTGKNCVING